MDAGFTVRLLGGEMRTLGGHGVVLDAIVAGLMAARVLAEAYRHVTDVERDHLPEVSEARKSVAQGSDAHALSTGGARVSQELLSRLLNDLVVNGPPTVANLSECLFSPGGHVLCQNEHSPPIVSYQPSRPHPERFAGNRLRRLPNDELVERQDLVALTASPGRDRVTGVQHRPIQQRAS